MKTSRWTSHIFPWKMTHKIIQYGCVRIWESSSRLSPHFTKRQAVLSPPLLSQSADLNSFTNTLWLPIHSTRQSVSELIGKQSCKFYLSLLKIENCQSKWLNSWMSALVATGKPRLFLKTIDTSLSVLSRNTLTNCFRSTQLPKQTRLLQREMRNSKEESR